MARQDYRNPAAFQDQWETFSDPRRATAVYHFAMLDTPMTDKQISDALYLALRIHIDKLPQMKGKGKTHDPSKIDDAVRALANNVRDNLRLCGITCLQSPPARSHSESSPDTPPPWTGRD